MKLSDKLFSTRMENKLSKQEVANRLNIDVTTYGRVESGKRSLEIDKLKLLYLSIILIPGYQRVLAGCTGFEPA